MKTVGELAAQFNAVSDYWFRDTEVKEILEPFIADIQRDAWEAGAAAQREKITVMINHTATGWYDLSGSIQVAEFPEAQ